MTVRELDTAIQNALKATASASAENQLSMTELRHALNEFFDQLEEKLQRRPQAREQSHWELVLVDGDPEQPAMFFLICVGPKDVAWTAGVGFPRSLRSLAPEGEQTMAELHPKLSEKFQVLAPVVVERNTFFAWSGYDPM